MIGGVTWSVYVGVCVCVRVCVCVCVGGGGWSKGHVSDVYGRNEINYELQMS